MATSSDVQAGCLRNQSRREWLSGKRRTAIATIGRALLLPDPASRVNEQLASAYNSGSGIPCCEFPSLPK
ncbi:MAG: hypothetical protein FJ125_13460 [Deltaproteobacteria bacterium]|nr:hypothetical protein [Deltaproteobacteria bacterium]